MRLTVKKSDKAPFCHAHGGGALREDLTKISVDILDAELARMLARSVTSRRARSVELRADLVRTTGGAERAVVDDETAASPEYEIEDE